jgi:AraC-like DNA-binding protein
MSRRRHTAADEPFFLIRTLAAEFRSGQTIDRHAHDWGQLIYASAGVTTVWTEAGSWVAPPHWAVWVPGGVKHSIRFAGETALRTLYLRPALASELPVECAAVTVSPLLRELIVRATTLGALDEREPVHEALALLILGEFRRSEAPPFDLPAPVSEEARKAAHMLTDGGSDAATEDIAREAGLSARTLERRFLTETGMSLGSWRRHARLLNALRELASGKPTKAVAHAAGYRTPSAFIAAFRATFGETPGRYFLPR